MRTITIIVFALVTLSAGCACEATDTALDAGGEDEAEEANGGDEATNDSDAGEENAEQQDGDGDGDGDEQEDDGDDGQTDGTDDDTTDTGGDTGTDRDRSSNYQQGLDLQNSTLDRSEGDFRSQCFQQSMQGDAGTGTIGFFTGNRFPVLADGYDILFFCSVDEQLPLPARLTLTDSTGAVWTETELQAGTETFSYEPANGHGVRTDAARAVEAAVGDAIYPVGQTYERNGQHVSSMMLRLPTARPNGAWTVQLTPENGTSRSLSLDLPACSASNGQVNPIATDFDVRFLSYRDEWEDRSEELMLGPNAIDNCRLVRTVIGLPMAEAETTLLDQVSFFGLDAPIRIVGACNPSATPGRYPVSRQPMGEITSQPGLELHVDAFCPPVPDFPSGSTVGDIKALLLDAAGSPDAPIDFMPDEACAGDDSEVSEVLEGGYSQLAYFHPLQRLTRRSGAALR